MSLKNKLTIIIFVLLVSIKVNSQIVDTTYVISFERAVYKPWSGTLVKLKIVEDYSFLKNIPNVACDTLVICSFNMNQRIENDSIPNQMYLFIGINENKKEKYVVVDVNNNHDFLDDHLYTFSLPDKPLTREEKAEKAVALRITPDTHKTDTVNIGIDPFNFFEYKYGQDEQLSVMIVFTEYMQAQAQIGGIPVEIVTENSRNLFQRDLNERLKCTICYSDNANKRTYKSFYPFKDTIHINDKLFKVSKVEHPNIYIKELGVLSDSSSIGSFMPTAYVRDINEHNLVSINDLIKDKYIFIDFWGSWCAPCIQSIPKLKSFYDEIKDRQDVLMLGIAKERDEKDVEKLKNIIDSREIAWLNLWLSNKEEIMPTSILSKLNITSFPT